MKLDEFFIAVIIFFGIAILIAQVAIHFHKMDRVERCHESIGNLDYCNRIYK